MDKQCHTTDAGLAGVCVSGCWVRGLLMSKKFWACFIAAFAVTYGFNWFWHGHYMMPDYQDTAMMWRPAAEMKMSTFVIAYAIQALAATYLILASMRTARWRDALMAGCKVGLFCVAGAFIMWNMMPFPSGNYNVPLKTGIGGVIDGFLIAIVIKLINSCCCKMCEKKDRPNVMNAG